MDGGNATIIAAVIAAVASLVSAGIALYNAKDSKKGAAQRDEVNNRTNSEIAMFEQDAENKRNETQIDSNWFCYANDNAHDCNCNGVNTIA